MATPAKPSWSLQRRLLYAITGFSAAVWLLALGLLGYVAWNETNEVFDDALRESGVLIMGATTDWNERALAEPSVRRVRKVDIQYQILAGDRLLQRTKGAPEQPFLSRTAGNNKFTDVRIGSKTWRVFSVQSADRRFRVIVGQDYKHRRKILYELAEHLYLPSLAALLLLVLASWFLIGRLLGPIRRTASAIHDKSPDDLGMLDTADQPAELLPVIDALNGMLVRVASALEHERRFTADAAHELRTPLAGIGMHIQLLQRQHPELEPAFRKLRQDVARTTALVDSLLTLARLDPVNQSDLSVGLVLLPPLFAELVHTFAGQAEERGIALRTRCEMAQVNANHELLRIVLRNLLDNALRYCAAGSAVELYAARSAGGLTLAVRDDGPGVPMPERARLAQRFFRVLGSGVSGNGLGLSIVRRIVELHGATLRFETGLDERGLGVEITFRLEDDR